MWQKMGMYKLREIGNCCLANKQIGGREDRDFFGKKPFCSDIKWFNEWKEKSEMHYCQRVKTVCNELNSCIESGKNPSGEILRLAASLPDAYRMKMLAKLNIAKCERFALYAAKFKALNPKFGYDIDAELRYCLKVEGGSKDFVVQKNIDASLKVFAEWTHLFNQHKKILNALDSVEIEAGNTHEENNFLLQLTQIFYACTTQPESKRAKKYFAKPEKSHLETLETKIVHFVEYGADAGEELDATRLGLPAKIVDGLKRLDDEETEGLKLFLNLKIGESFGLFRNEMCRLGMEITDYPKTFYTLKGSRWEKYGGGWQDEESLRRLFKLYNDDEFASIKNELKHHVEGFGIVIGPNSNSGKADIILAQADEWREKLLRFEHVVYQFSRSTGKTGPESHLDSSWFEANYHASLSLIKRWAYHNRPAQNV